METYDIEEIKSNMEGMSLREKIEYLHECQEDIMREIEGLESVESEVEDLLTEVTDQVDEKNESEIASVLNDVIAAHPGVDCSLLTNNKLDIAGLQFQFIRLGACFDELHVSISGRNFIVRTGAFMAEFKDLIKPLLPDAVCDSMSFHLPIATETDAASLVRDIAEKLVSVTPRLAELAKKYKAV